MKIRRQALALVGAFFLISPAAFADPAIEGVLKNWVAAIDASPDWAASYRDIAYDAGSDTATLSGLAITSETLGMEVDFETLTVVGYTELPDNAFKVSEVTLVGGSFKGTFGAVAATVAIDGVELDDLSVPQLAPVVIDKEKPFTSMMKAYGEFNKLSLKHSAIRSIEIIEQIEGQTSRISYSNLEMTGFANGKAASMTSGPMKMEGPSPQGLVTFSVGGFEARDMDLGAVVHVYSPAAYVNGVGDMEWRTGLAFAAYRDIAIDAPGARVTFGSWVIENFRLRQPHKSFGELLDIMMSHPSLPEEEMNKIAADHVIDMFSAFGLGRFELNDMQVIADGVDRATLGDFHMNDISIDGFGEIGISNLDVAVSGQGALKLGRLAFGGITFPKIEDLEAAIAAAERNEEPANANALIPTLGYFEVGGVDINAPEVPRISLGQFRLDLSDYIGPVPTTIAADLVGLTIPVSSITDDDLKGMLQRFGYQMIDASYGLRMHWTEATETVSVDDAHFDLKGMGGIAASFALTGLSRSQIENPEILKEALDNLSLAAARITFQDDSIVGKGLDLLAEKMKAPPDKFRQQFADAMPFFLSMATISDPRIGAAINKSGLLGKLAPAVKNFVANPGSSITITLSPERPVPLPEIENASETAPESLIGLLGMSVAEGPGSPAPDAPANGDRGPEETKPTVQ